jgi:acetyl esterase/lipase
MNWGTMSRAERDAAYNNPAAVPESATLLAEWRTASLCSVWHVASRSTPRAARTQHLGPVGKVDSNAPCLVFIHGGYWQRNSGHVNSDAGPYAHGWAVALPGYTRRLTRRSPRLLPNHTALDCLSRSMVCFSRDRRPDRCIRWSAGGLI